MIWGMAPLTGAELPPEWVIGAPCGQADPEVFFVGKGGNVEPAKRICSVCPVLDLCREWAIARPDEYGVWGGMTEKERSRERARRRGEVGGTELECIQCGESFFTDHASRALCSEECRHARTLARQARYDRKRRAAA